MRGAQLKVRIVVAIAVFGYSVCKFGGNLSPVTACLGTACTKEGRNPSYFYFSYVVLGTAKYGW